jgi:hypothetical protein
MGRPSSLLARPWSNLASPLSSSFPHFLNSSLHCRCFFMLTSLFTPIPMLPCSSSFQLENHHITAMESSMIGQISIPAVTMEQSAVSNKKEE